MTHRTQIQLLFALFLLTTLCQCQEKGSQELDGYGKEYPQTKETFAAIDSCMGYMNSDPEKARRMLDSLRDARTISPQRCEYLHATVLYGGEENADSALMICNRLLDENNFGDDTYLEEEICVLASNITSELERHLETLKYANRGIAICHGHETMRSDEAMLMGRAGMAEKMLGNTAKARETYDAAYRLLKDDKTFGGLIGIISIMKKQTGLHFDAGEYDDAISISRNVLSIVQSFDRDPSAIDPRPETMRQSGEGTRGFADFYESQMYGNIARAYHMKIESGRSANARADADSVRLYIDRWCQTSSSQSPSSQAGVLSELLFTGHREEFAVAKKSVGEMYKSDSLVNGYVEYLTILAHDAAANNDFRSSKALLQRAVAVGDSIRRKDMLRTLSEQMSINMVQEQQLARQDAEYQVSRQRIVIILLSAVLVIMLGAGAIIAILIRRRRKDEQIIEMTQQSLTETKEELMEVSQQLEESKKEKYVNNAKALFNRIEQIMAEKKLYLNPDLDVRMLSEEICSSRTSISISINSVTGKTFRQWLSEYRLQLFIKMMKETPDAPLDDLIKACGYQDQSTFRRQFKASYGMTPGEYRRMIISSEQNQQSNK